jgi:hypothetical protein
MLTDTIKMFAEWHQEIGLENQLGLADTRDEMNNWLKMGKEQ